MFEFLNRPLFGLPIWIWLLIVLGGVLVAKFLIPKLTGAASSAGSSSSLGSGTTSSGSSGSSGSATPDPNLDPNTGVPYAVEEATNPATGLPNYNNLVGLQSTTQGIAASQGAGTTGAAAGSTNTGASTSSTPDAAAPQYVTVANYTNASDLKSNDTLYNIAENAGFGSNWQAVWKLNPQIANPYLLTPGQQVRIS